MIGKKSKVPEHRLAIVSFFVTDKDVEVASKGLIAVDALPHKRAAWPNIRVLVNICESQIIQYFYLLSTSEPLKAGHLASKV
jgi:hypothetical protein